MIMKFASAQARQTADKAQEQENARITATAENIIATMIEPKIETRATLGKRTAEIRFHYCWDKVYEKAAEILQDNGYTATMESGWLKVEW